MPDVKPSLPRTHHKLKRKRGAQKGNKNALKHGFYSSTLGVSETCELWNIVNLEGLAIETAVLRVKLKSVLQQDPGNRRVLIQASKLLAKWYCAKYGLDRAGSHCLKAAVRDALEHYHEQPPQDRAQHDLNPASQRGHRCEEAGHRNGGRRGKIGFYKTNQEYFNN